MIVLLLAVAVNVEATVASIVRADYAGDRAALARLREELPDQRDKLILYWRGFASWRRAFNGFNDGTDPRDLGDDLEKALADFEKAASLDETFADAKAAAASCLFTLTFMHRQDPAAVKRYVSQAMPLMKDALRLQPGNPRVLWVWGADLWYLPESRGGGEAKAIATYEQGLRGARAETRRTSALEPRWGEPELLMNLAWANAHRQKPDREAAEKYARAALTLVPDWHYVRDLLLPQIQRQ
jgi:tetratricopeptide (TPR) repeat protein